jgi:steroid 5-alpha reductase family enzyme
MFLHVFKQSNTIVGSINLVGFIITAITKTHKLTDLLGTGSFVVATVFMSYQSYLNLSSHKSQLPFYVNRLFWINCAVILWGSRLGIYLFQRILKTHEDRRLKSFFPQSDEKWFDIRKSNFPINLGGFWFLQALWAIICLLPVMMINSLTYQLLSSNSSLFTGKPSQHILSSLNIVENPFSLPYVPSSLIEKNSFLFHSLSSLLIFLFTFLPLISVYAGIITEAMADYQKDQYRSSKENEHHWCDIGLWSKSRHPNCKIVVSLF